MTGFQSKKAMAMGKVKDLTYEIQELFIDGASASQIAGELEITVREVQTVLNSFGVSDEDILADEEIYSPYNGA